MKITRIFLTTTLVSASVLGFGWASPASAKTYVQCGPNAAAYLVDKVPVGCHVLPANNYGPVNTKFERSSEMMDTTEPDTGATTEPGSDTQGPNAAPDTSPGTPGSAFPDSSDTTPDNTFPTPDTTSPAPDTNPGSMMEPGSDTQGPNAAPDTSPGTPGSAFPGQ